MKILMVGVLDKPQSTNVFMAKALRGLGHEVVELNYRNFRDPEDQMVESVIQENPALAILCKVSGTDPDAIRRMNEYTKTWYWFMDPIATMNKVKATRYAKESSFASSTSGEVLQEFKAVNPKTYKIFEGFDDELYWDRSEVRSGVVFVGASTDKRIKYVNFLRGKGIPVTTYGPKWPNSHSVFNEDLAEVYNKAEICLNVCRSQIFSDRIVIAMGCGAMVMTEHCLDVEATFERRKHLDWFQNPAECFVVIRRYLADRQLARQVGMQGNTYATENFTWKNQMSKLLDIARSKTS